MWFVVELILTTLTADIVYNDMIDDFIKLDIVSDVFKQRPLHKVITRKLKIF